MVRLVEFINDERKDSFVAINPKAVGYFYPTRIGTTKGTIKGTAIGIAGNGDVFCVHEAYEIVKAKLEADEK